MLMGGFPGNSFPKRSWPDRSWPGYGGGTPPIPPTPHHREEEHGGATYFRPIFPWEILEDDEEVLLIAGALL